MCYDFIYLYNFAFLVTNNHLISFTCLVFYVYITFPHRHPWCLAVAFRKCSDESDDFLSWTTTTYPPPQPASSCTYQDKVQLSSWDFPSPCPSYFPESHIMLFLDLLLIPKKGCLGVKFSCLKIHLFIYLVDGLGVEL